MDKELNGSPLLSKSTCNDTFDEEEENKVKEIIEILQLMVNNGADLDAKDNSGHTPLHLAVAYHTTTVDIVKYLLDEGAQFDALNNNYETPHDLIIRNIDRPDQDVYDEEILVLQLLSDKAIEKRRREHEHQRENEATVAKKRKLK